MFEKIINFYHSEQTEKIPSHAERYTRLSLSKKGTHIFVLTIFFHCIQIERQT